MIIDMEILIGISTVIVFVIFGFFKFKKANDKNTCCK